MKLRLEKEAFIPIMPTEAITVYFMFPRTTKQTSACIVYQRELVFFPPSSLYGETKHVFPEIIACYLDGEREKKNNDENEWLQCVFYFKI